MKITILEKEAGQEDELLVKCDYLDEGLTKLINQFKSGKGKMNFYKDSKIVFVEPDEIFYFESVDDNVFVILFLGLVSGGAFGIFYTILVYILDFNQAKKINQKLMDRRKKLEEE